MRDLTEETLTRAALHKLSETSDPRLKEIMSSFIQCLHTFLREVEPTQDEWFEAIQFLTEIGQKCSEKRQEFILMSDVLGASMLIDAINNRKIAGATESSVLGPYYRESAPDLKPGDSLNTTEDGERVLVQGLVCGKNRVPISGAILDVWQTAPNGLYDVQDPKQPDMNLRGKVHTDVNGQYVFQTVIPTSYPIPTDGPVGKMLSGLGWHPNRPAHIHFIVSAKGFKPVTTQVFIDGDPYLESDAVFAVKDSLVAKIVRHEKSSPSDPTEQKPSMAPSQLNYDFQLEPAP